MMDVTALTNQEQQVIRSRYSVHQNEAEIYSRKLAEFSHPLLTTWGSLGTRINSVVLQHIEFVKLKRYLVLAILVNTAGLVQNRMIEVEEDFSQSELDHLSDYMNDLLAGLTLTRPGRRFWSR